MTSTVLQWRPCWGEPDFWRQAVGTVLAVGVLPAGFLALVGASAGMPAWAYPLLLVAAIGGALALSLWQWGRESARLVREGDTLRLENVMGQPLAMLSGAEKRTVQVYWLRRDASSLLRRMLIRSTPEAESLLWVRVRLQSASEDEQLTLDLPGDRGEMALRWLDYGTLADSLAQAASDHPDASLLEALVETHTVAEADLAAFKIYRRTFEQQRGLRT